MSKKHIWFIVMLLLTTAILTPATLAASIYSSDISGLSVSNLSGTWAGNSVDAGEIDKVKECTGTGDGFIARAIGHQGIFSAYAAKVTVNLKNTSGVAATLSFSIKNYTGSVTINGESAETLGNSFSVKLDKDASVTIVLTSPYESKPASLEVSALRVEPVKMVNITFLPAEHGSYTVDGTTISSETSIEKESTESFSVVTSADNDYRFFYWCNAETGEQIYFKESGDWLLNESQQVKPVFVEASAGMFEVNRTKRYTDLNEANEFATTLGGATIAMIENSVLSNGEYYISKNNILLIPFDSAQTLYKEVPDPEVFGGKSTSAYRTLTIGTDAHIYVDGAISVSSRQASTSGPATGNPSGAYGYIKMQEGSSITINNGASLYAWGYISGSGVITAKNGSTVYECFQVADWRGGSATSRISGTRSSVFACSQ